MPVLVVLAGCGHGKYTSEFLDEARGDRNRLHGATQYDLAVQQFNSGDLERALTTLESSIALAGTTAPSELLRGRILLEMGRSDEALAALERGLQMDEANPEFHYYRGIAYERIGDTDSALADYRAAATADPSAAQYVLAVAEVLMEMDRLEEARTFLESQTGDFELTPGVRQALGHVAMLQGEYAMAIRYFEEATVLGDGDPVFREDLCHAQVAAQRFAEAELTLRLLTREKAYTDRTDLKHLHASCLIMLSRPVEARRILYRLVRTESGSQNVEAWIKLVDVALMIEDDGLLLVAANRLVATAPERVEGFMALAVWHRRAGDLPAALRTLDRVIDRADQNPAPSQLHAIITSELEGDAG